MLHNFYAKVIVDSVSVIKNGSFLAATFLVICSGVVFGDDKVADDKVADDKAAQEKAAQEKAAQGPWLSCIRWLDDNQLVATKSEGLLLRPAQVVKLSAAAPDKIEAVGEQPTSLWSIVTLPENHYAVSDYKGGVYLYGNGEPQKFEFEARWIRALEKSPNSDEILAGTEDGKLIVLSPKDKKEVRRADAATATIFDIAFSHAGDKVALAVGDGSIKLLSWPKLEPIASMSRGKEGLWSVVFTADDQQLISGGADRRIQLWDIAKAKSVMTIKMASDWVTNLVALPNSSAVAGTCLNGQVFVVDYKTMLPVTDAKVAESAIWSAALSPNGQQLAIGTRKHGAALQPIGAWVSAAAEAAKSEQANEHPPVPK